MGSGAKGGPSGTTTSTSNTTPWSEQQPYLRDIFSQSQNLYNNNAPQYYPNATLATPNDTQNTALNTIIYNAQNNPLASQAGTANNSFLSGAVARTDPAIAPLTQLATTNLGTPYSDTLSPYLSGSRLNNPYTSALNPILSGQERITNSYTPDTSALNPILSGQQRVTNSYTPDTSALNSYTSGQRQQAGNPYSSALANSILSRAIPAAQTSFIMGGALNSPEAARATSEGATAALAAPFFQQYQQEEANQLQAQQQGAQQQQAGSQLGMTAQQATINALLGAQGQGAQQQQVGSQLGMQAQQGNINSLLGAQGQAAGQYQQGQANQLTAQGQAAQQAQQSQNLQLQGATGLQNAYGQNTQQILYALGLAPQTQQLPYTDAAQAYGAGATQQQNTQQAINDAVQRWNYGQTLPFQQLNQYIGGVTGNYGGTTVATQPYFNNQTGNAIGGLGAFGSLLGGIGSLLPSDRRLKRDIRQIDTLDNGLPFYAFRYRGEPMLHVGVMADEVERIHPEAVLYDPYGYAKVDYARALR